MICRGLKAGLHIVVTIVVTIAQHVFDDAPKGILKLSLYRFQIFLVKGQYLWSLEQCRDQAISVQLKPGFQIARMVGNYVTDQSGTLSQHMETICRGFTQTSPTSRQVSGNLNLVQLCRLSPTGSRKAWRKFSYENILFLIVGDVRNQNWSHDYR